MNPRKVARLIDTIAYYAGHNAESRREVYEALKQLAEVIKEEAKEEMRIEMQSQAAGNRPA